MGFRTSVIEFDYTENSETKQFIGTVWYPDGSPVKEIVNQILEENNQKIIIDSIQLDGYFVKNFINA